MGDAGWLAMVTGARRGELCAVRSQHVDLDQGVLTVRRAIAQGKSGTWEKDKRRGVSLEAVTVELLAAYRELLAGKLAQLDAELAAGTFLFSTSPGRRTRLRPSSVSQRYRRMCAPLGWDMDIKELRHYSATELVAAGVDVRTVAGRLGHGSGGVTTLRVYGAWRPKADRRDSLRSPSHSATSAADWARRGRSAPRAPQDSSAPWHQIATHLRGAILCGAIGPGDQLPTVTELSGRYEVAPSTAHRAIAELAASRLITVRRGKRAVVSTRRSSARGDVRIRPAAEACAAVSRDADHPELKLCVTADAVGRLGFGFHNELNPGRAEGIAVRASRAVFVLVLAAVLSGVTQAPAMAARPLATPQFTSAVVVDSRTVTLSWTPVKGAHHYVVEYAPGMRVYTTDTSVTITDLYPGDGHYFTVRAETRRNVPSATSDPIVVPTPPEGPLSPSAAQVPFRDGIRIWWTSGIGCATYELATVAPDGTYSAPVQPIFIEDPTMWQVAQDPGTTVTYAVRCASSYGLYSPWSDPTVVTLDPA